MPSDWDERNSHCIRGSTYSSEEGEDVFDKVSLIVVQLVLPVVEIRGKVDLFRCPERCLCLFVHLPDLHVSNGLYEDESVDLPLCT